ncbi:hypothetical protein L228DRAFT_214821 [Xylona heveae TC161]|uniref:Uncharacterized protein n=1 Tax=Xylona heveae (strain CBS 132557 / TC161) TaxID=1328760 RepID=A0A164ZU70_XYLHT|nr:hypothetical protein L228DRAFT_214821 [Xylona heveae TC161]KZF19523.1 hypothetical protein L228DRAFT_214821 [Xylona heveae TC161]
MPPFLNGNGLTNGHGGNDEDPIAIVGMACRFPQDADNAEKFWDFLINGRSAMTTFPKEKFEFEGHYHPDPGHASTMNAKGGHFLKEKSATFDAPFFSITKNEAISMDPQQRLVMENVYHAIENAGIPMEKMLSSKTSVFLGAFTNDYLGIVNSDPDALLKYKPIGTANSILANRVSWFFDLKGSSLMLDTACSSSLVALHLACQNLKNKESEMAIVSGVNVIESPETMYGMSKIGFLSPDGICYSFDHRANGYSRGEGVGTILIKRLSAAIRDGDTVRAVIRATGSNHDGRTPGITLPSKTAQEALIRDTYASVGLNTKSTNYIEAHGTGTAAGDPIEAGAIAAAFSDRPSQDPLLIGALKSNVGHLEAASGVAGLIKTVMILERGLVPPNINFEKVNPKIPMKRWNIDFPLKPTPWTASGVRRASVNSFGFGGANAHVVLDDAYSYLQEQGLRGIHLTKSISSITANGNNGAPHLEKSTSKIFAWSAFDEAGIKRQVDSYHSFLSTVKSDDEPGFLDDLAYTLSDRRTLFPWRSFAVAESLVELVEKLAQDHGVSKPIRSKAPPKLGFIFTGQGAQWYAMGRELLVYPAFSKSFEDAAAYIKSIGSDWNIVDELLRDRESSNIGHPVLSQTLCTVLQVALVDLLASWSISPTRVVGHSSGEIAAAYAAGAFGREAAWKIAYYRGLVSASLMDQKGAMIAVGLSTADAQSYLNKVHDKLSGELTIACFNSPKSLTISGDEAKVDALKSLLDENRVFARKLNVKNAYHSSHMRAVADEYLNLMGDLGAPRASQGTKSQSQDTSMFSSVTGELVTIDALNKPQYWVDNMVSPVKFTQALTSLCSTAPTKTRARMGISSGSPVQHLIEVGPHPALQSATKDTLSVDPSLGSLDYSYLLSRSNTALTSILQTVGTLFCQGYPVDLHAVNHKSLTAEEVDSIPSRLLVNLPPYSFNHSQDYWPESRLSKRFRQRKYPRHDILGAPVSDWNPEEPRWRQIIRISENPWLKDHRVTGSIVFPGVGYLVMAIEASKQIADPEQRIAGYRLRDVSIKAALVIPDVDEGVDTVLSMHRVTETARASSAAWWEFRISSYGASNDSWLEHCRGVVGIEYESTPGPLNSGLEVASHAQEFEEMLDRVYSICESRLDSSHLYSDLETIGISFGPTFRNLESVKHGKGNGDSTGTVTVPNLKAAMPKGHIHPHVIHPAVMDSMLHLFLAAVLDSNGGKKILEPLVPVFIKDVWVDGNISSEPGHIYRCHGWAGKISATQYNSEITVWEGDTKAPRMTVRGMQVVPLQSTTTNSATERQLCYNIDWRPDVDLMSKERGEAYFGKTLSELALQDSLILQLSQDLQLANIVYILDATKELEGIDETTLGPHHKKYLAWLRLQSDNYAKGLIFHQRPEWDLVVNDEELKEKFLKKVEKSGADGQLAYRMGPQIAPILRHEADALQLMFGDDLLDIYYRELIGTKSIHKLLAAYADNIGHKRVDLAVLEIGAGTGGSTLPILETLCPRSADSSASGSSKLASYTYTDISAGFFEKAKAKFKPWTNLMHFKTLNIEKDPAKQGFEAGSFDIILAANVLHATQDLRHTLRNARYLLKPGGKLLLHEGTQRHVLSLPMSFGLLPGWWLSAEENRKWGPLMSEVEWSDFLADTGFSGMDLALKDNVDDRIHSQSLMVSTAVDPDRARVAPLEVIIIASEKQRAGQVVPLLASSLAGLGLREIQIATPQEVASMELKQSVCIALMELDKPFLTNISKTDYDSLRHLLTQCAGLLWVTADHTLNPELSMISGLVRTVRWERDLDDSNLVTLAIQDSSLTEIDLSSAIMDIYKVQFWDKADQRHGEYSYRDGLVYINRLTNAQDVNGFLASKSSAPAPQPQPFGADSDRALKLRTDAPGILNRLHFADDPDWHLPLPDDEIEVEVKASGLTFRDVVVAMGEVPSSTFGEEGAGIVTRVGANISDIQPGDRVVFVSSGKGSLQTFARVKSYLTAKIPLEMSFEVASGIPCNYMTAYYCLVDAARLRKGESILIHAAAGGTGQAAIMFAQNVGAEIFATVSTQEKKDLLTQTYGIPEDHIFSSRDLTFAQGVMRLTKGRGVNVILNSLAGEALRKSWDCIAPFGRFIEIGKKDIYANGKLDMWPFSKSVTFAACDLATVVQLDPETSLRLLKDCVRFFAEGTLKTSTPYTVLDYSQIEDAFRQMQSGKSIGKIVLVPHKDDIVPVVPKSLSAYRFGEDASYILAGGLGGLGRSIAQWMVSRGARNLVFLNRTEPPDNVKEFLQDINSKGCKTLVCVCDVSNKDSLLGVIEKCNAEMPPIKGCIQGAMQLKDSAFENMTYDDFNAALAPKVQGSWNLHTLLPKDMDFMIFLSSISGIAGNRGQGNYAAGNTYQDALAHYRVSQGLPGTALDLGNILSVGFLAEHKKVVSSNPIFALIRDGIREDEFLSIIEYHVDQRNADESDLRCQVAFGLNTSAALKRKGVPEPTFMSNPLFAQLHSVAETGGDDSGDYSYQAIQELLRSANTVDEATNAVQESIVRRLSNTMSIPTDDVDPSKPIHHYGVDSLVAMEFRNWFAKDMAADVAVLDIMGFGSISTLSRKIVSVSKVVKLAALGEVK